MHLIAAELIQVDASCLSNELLGIQKLLGLPVPPLHGLSLIPVVPAGIIVDSMAWQATTSDCATWAARYARSSAVSPKVHKWKLDRAIRNLEFSAVNLHIQF